MLGEVEAGPKQPPAASPVAPLNLQAGAGSAAAKKSSPKSKLKGAVHMLNASVRDNMMVAGDEQRGQILRQLRDGVERAPWCVPPHNMGVPPNAMARITSDCGAMRYPGVKWP